jgi:small conductance mechanosensitive channel
MEEILQKFMEMILLYAPKLALAIITLVIGLWAIGKLTNFVKASMKRSKMDETLIPFTSHLISWTLKVLLFVSVASMVGIATTSFIAVLGAAGLAIGLALQGSLANFAGGVLILIFKPYKIGDLIEANGHVGTVKEVQIFNTILLTPKNEKVVVPNGPMSNNSLTNYTAEGTRRIDLVIGISYDANIDEARKILLEVMENDENVLTSPSPFVGVDSLGDSSVNLAVRPWTTNENYWDVYFGITEKAKKALDANNISIPFPQRDVHLFEHKS